MHNIDLTIIIAIGYGKHVSMAFYRKMLIEQTIYRLCFAMAKVKRAMNSRPRCKHCMHFKEEKKGDRKGPSPTIIDRFT